MTHNDITCSKYNEPVLPDEEGNCSLCGAKLTSSRDPHTLVVNITDQETTFTEQLEKIISDINEGYTSGYGWSTNELEPDDRENTAPKKKAKTPLDEIRMRFEVLSNIKQNMVMKQYIDYVENFPDEHDGGSYPVSFLEWYTNEYQYM